MPAKCIECKELHDLDVKNNINPPRKITQATYGDPKTNKSTVCKEHLKNKVGYIALRNKSQWCIGEDLVEENGEIVLKRCIITASYGTDKKKFIHCKKHSIEGEVDNRSKKCEECKKLYHDKKITIKNINQAIWGITTKERCTTHKNDNDTMLGSKECIHKDCNKLASFGPENKRLYCSNHNEKNYPTCIKRPECEKEGCINEASYGTEKEGRVRCSIDKKKNDIDFKNIRICLNEDCYIHASFGLEKDKPLFCERHNLMKYENVVNKRCEYEDCKIRACFGDKDTKSTIFCFSHKEKDHVDNVYKRCVICFGPRAWKKDSNNRQLYCSKCYYDLYPQSKDKKIYMFKQKTIIELLEKQLKEKYENFKFDLVDRLVPNGISKRRPDLIILPKEHKYLGHSEEYVINIEIDENQHNSIYYSEGQDERTEELIKDFKNIPYVLIRFNPDFYKKNNKRHPSCFKIGVQEINEKELNRRIKKLVEEIEYYMKNKPSDRLIENKLFYNDNMYTEVFKDEKEVNLVFLD
jgi:hypothetical protein